MSHREYLFPLWVRLWHWANALLFALLIVTGTTLHFSTMSRVFDFNLARDIHNLSGVALVAVWLVFLVGSLVTGNWRQFVPRLSGLIGRVVLQIHYYVVGIFKGEARPFPPTADRNFNPLQQTAYLGIMFVGMPLLLVTGILFLWPELLPDKLFGFDSLLTVALLHFLLGFIMLVFMLVHIYMCTCGPKLGSDFKSMITGWEEG